MAHSGISSLCKDHSGLAWNKSIINQIIPPRRSEFKLLKEKFTVHLLVVKSQWVKCKKHPSIHGFTM